MNMAAEEHVKGKRKWNIRTALLSHKLYGLIIFQRLVDPALITRQMGELVIVTAR